MKTSLPRHGTVKPLYDSYFCEYIIRKKDLNDSDDKFLAFLQLIKRVYPVQIQVPSSTTSVPSSVLSNKTNLNFSSSSLDDFQI